MKNLSKISFWALSLTLFSCSGNTTISTSNDFQVAELPDGSVAYINYNSSVEYNKDFNPRKITQTGEVFYRVTKEGTPFVVKTELGEITVLGTEFNVNSSSEEMEVEVEQGTVEVKSNASETARKVKKGEKASVHNTSEGISIGKADFNYKTWIKDLEVAFKEMGKDFKEAGKVLVKRVKKLAKK